MHEQETAGLGEREETPDNEETNSNEEPGGGLTADDLAQPTTTADPTGDRATGLTGMRGG